MTKDVYNLARISRGEEGKTAYFLYNTYEDMPSTIEWAWPDGITSFHTKLSAGETYKKETSEEWWKKYVRNAEWPGFSLIEDLFEDVFIPVYTKTFKYQLTDKKHTHEPAPKKKKGKTTLKNNVFTGTSVWTTPLDEYGNPASAPFEAGESATPWATATPEQIVSDIQTAKKHIEEEYYGVHSGKLIDYAQKDAELVSKFINLSHMGNYSINVTASGSNMDQLYKIVGPKSNWFV